MNEEKSYELRAEDFCRWLQENRAFFTISSGTICINFMIEDHSVKEYELRFYAGGTTELYDHKRIAKTSQINPKE